MKLLTVLGFAIIVSGCQSTSPNLITRQNVAVEIPREITNACPEAPKLPKASTLTDIQVADLVRRLYGNNVKCYQAMQEVRNISNNFVNVLETSK